MTIGEQLEIFLVKNNITQSELAKKLGVAVSTPGKWINGRAISNQYMEKLNAIGFKLKNTQPTYNEKVYNECCIIGEKIKEFRIAKNMYQKELGEKINQLPYFISEIEKGEIDIRKCRYEKIRNKLTKLFPKLNNFINNEIDSKIINEYVNREKKNENPLINDIEDYLHDHRLNYSFIAKLLNINGSSVSRWKDNRSQISLKNLEMLFNENIVSLSTYNEIRKRVRIGELIKESIKRRTNINTNDFYKKIGIDEKRYNKITRGIIDYSPYKDKIVRILDIEETMNKVEKYYNNKSTINNSNEENTQKDNYIIDTKENIQANNDIYLFLFKLLYKEINEIDKDEIEKIKILEEKIKIVNSLNNNNGKILLLLLSEKLK